MSREQWEALSGLAAIALVGSVMAGSARFALLVGRVFRLGIPLPPQAAPVYRVLGGILALMAIGILLVFGVRQGLHPGS